MQSLNDNERSDVLGEVLADELKVIKEYVQEVPKVTQELHHVTSMVEVISDKLTVISAVVKDHEIALRKLSQKAT